MLNQVFILWSFALWAWQLFFFMTFHAHTHTPTYVHTLEFFVKHIFSWHMHFYLQKYQVTAGFLLPYALYAFTILKISRSETRNSTFQSNFCFTLIPVFVADRNFDQYTARFLLVHTILSLSLSLSLWRIFLDPLHRKLRVRGLVCDRRWLSIFFTTTTVYLGKDMGQFVSWISTAIWFLALRF